MPPLDAVSPDRHRLAGQVRRVPSFSWKLLSAFLVLAVACSGLYAYAALTRPAPAPPAIATPGNASRLLGPDDAPAAPPAATDSWSGWAGAKGATLGFGFVGGFLIGFVFRAFLKLMTLVTVVIGGTLLLLSYYHVINVDFTQARDVVQSNAQWLTEQATRLKDSLVAYLPSSTGGAVGAFFGFRRR